MKSTKKIIRISKFHQHVGYKKNIQNSCVSTYKQLSEIKDPLQQHNIKLRKILQKI